MVGRCQESCPQTVLNGLNIFLNLIKNFVQKNKEGYFLKVDNLHNFQNNLPFLPERMKIEKVEKLVADLHDKNEYAIHIKNLKQTLNHGVVLEKCVEWLNLIKRCG